MFYIQNFMHLNKALIAFSHSGRNIPMPRPDAGPPYVSPVSGSPLGRRNKQLLSAEVLIESSWETSCPGRCKMEPKGEETRSLISSPRRWLDRRLHPRRPALSGRPRVGGAAGQRPGRGRAGAEKLGRRRAPHGRGRVYPCAALRC